MNPRAGICGSICLSRLIEPLAGSLFRSTTARQRQMRVASFATSSVPARCVSPHSYPLSYPLSGYCCAIPCRAMDNGKEFTDRLFGLHKRAQSGKHEFDKLCTAMDIEHRLTPPKSPQTNGPPLGDCGQSPAGQRVERFNGRIEDLLQGHHFQSGEKLEATRHRYVRLYNQQLPQSALGSKTPLQVMKDWHNLKPDLFKKQPY